MALLAASLTASADPMWSGCGLEVVGLAAPDASRDQLDRGLESLLTAVELPRTRWVVALSGDGEALGYACDVLDVATPVAIGRGASWAAAAVVDAFGGSGVRLRVLLLQVDEARGDPAADALRRGDVVAALRSARLVLQRDAASTVVTAGVGPAAMPVLRRMTAPVVADRLPRAPAPRRHELRVHRGGRVGAAVASLLVAALVASGAVWTVTHRTAPRLAASPTPALVVPAPRVGAMAATWDRTAQVVLFGGATPGGPGHGEPLGDTWRGALPPAAPWQRMPAEPVQPLPRLGGAMAADAAAGDVVLFGGESAGDAGLDDTWIYGGGWAAVTPTDVPPAGPALAATEPSTGRVLLVATCCALGPVPTSERMQTWRWTGSDWSLLGPAPGWVSTAALVSDPWDDAVVMVADGGDGRDATFVWNGSAWSSAASGPEPPHTAGTRPALAYDPASHAVLDVVTDDAGATHTWSFTSAHGWTRLPDAYAAPPVVGLVLAEPVDGRAMLYGGPDQAGALSQRWFWFDGAWTESLQPAPVAAVPTAGYGATVAADPTGGGLVLFGGSGALSQTWVWTGAGWWDEFFTAPIPAPRLGASMAYDPRSGTALLVGGRLADGTSAQDTWLWHGGTWSRLAPDALPPPTVGAPMAWDAAHQEAVLLTFDESNGLPLAETWTWDGSTWTHREPSTSPPLRAESSMDFDPATGMVMLTVPCCRGALDQRTETWTWDGTTWARRPTFHQPPTHAVIAADPSHHRTLLVAACCNGFDPATSIGAPQTWTWDGVDWKRVTGAPLPALQDVAALTTDAHGTPLLVGRVAGAGPRHPLDGLWSWAGAGWVRLV
jgi:hypothetical protein